mmetsp:Transcript_139185/g.444775  ORF Transcript_139185/g.444775 Transcript_139185/m.444775 type:complete len:231 (+) Transcript_139185:189-881(+)
MLPTHRQAIQQQAGKFAARPVIQRNGTKPCRSRCLGPTHKLGGELAARLHARRDRLLHQFLSRELSACDAVALRSQPTEFAVEVVDLAVAKVAGRDAPNGFHCGVDPYQLDPMPVARDQLATRGVRQSDVARRSNFLLAAAADPALHVVSPSAGVYGCMVRHNSQHLYVVEFGPLAVRIHGVDDGASLRSHHSLTLVRTQLAEHLQLLRHLIVLQIRKVKLQAKLLVALT